MQIEAVINRTNAFTTSGKQKLFQTFILQFNWRFQNNSENINIQVSFLTSRNNFFCGSSTTKVALHSPVIVLKDNVVTSKRATLMVKTTATLGTS